MDLADAHVDHTRRLEGSECGLSSNDLRKQEHVTPLEERSHVAHVVKRSIIGIAEVAWTFTAVVPNMLDATTSLASRRLAAGTWGQMCYEIARCWFMTESRSMDPTVDIDGLLASMVAKRRCADAQRLSIGGAPPVE